MITELLPETIRQLALWGELDRDRREQAWMVMDKLNGTLWRELALKAPHSFARNYVGYTQLAKKHGRLRMFLLRRHSGA